MFKEIPPQLQCILALILPVLREFNLRMLTKLMLRWADCNDLITKSIANIIINSTHSLFLVIYIGTLATEVTAYIILIEEFVFNLYSCYKIWKLHRKINQNAIPTVMLRAIEEEVQMLVLTESLEILVPLAYTITFLFAYYGPNAEILGNVRNNYWQYDEVHDVNKLLLSVFEMFVIDTGSIVIGGILLWKSCSINVVKEYCSTIKRYWKVISIRLAVETAKVS